MRKFNGRIIDAQTGHVIAVTEDFNKGLLAAEAVKQLITKMGLVDLTPQVDEEGMPIKVKTPTSCYEEIDPYDPDAKVIIKNTCIWDVTNTVV